MSPRRRREKHSPDDPKLEDRECLKCHKPFTPRHRGNFLCKNCFNLNRIHESPYEP